MAALSGINNLLFIGFLFKALASFRASQRFLNSPGVKIIPNVKFSGNTLKVLNVDGGAARTWRTSSTMPGALPMC